MIIRRALLTSAARAGVVLALGAAIAAPGAPAARAAPAAPDAPAARAARVIDTAPDVPTGAHVAAPRAHAAGEVLMYGGGPVLHANRTHLIFWQPSGSGLSFEPGYESLLETFLTHVAADSHMPTNVYGLSGQYRDSGGPAAYDSSYGGALVDTDPLPGSGCTEPLLTGPGWLVCVNATQLQDELEHVIVSRALPSGPEDVYFLVTPAGLGSCTGYGPQNCALGGTETAGYCGYHAVSTAGTPYAVIPYNAVPGHCQSGVPRPNSSPADPAISTVSHEHNEMVTDPTGTAWTDASGNEDGDLCLTSFGRDLGGSGSSAYNAVIHGGHYYIQEEWSNDDGSCQPRDEADSLSAKAPRQGTVADALSLLAAATDPDGSIVRYDWFFGDGKTASGRSVTHVFRRAGTDRFVLRSTDSADNYAFYDGVIRLNARRAKHRRAGR